MSILNDELVRECRQGSSVGIAIADVDHFKRVNDTYGHPVGDEVLRKIAQAMRESVRRYDAVGRFGGEEFVIVFPGCDTANAVSHAERLRAAVSRVVVETPRGNVSPTISLGVVVAHQQASPDASDAIEAADMALYRAKQGGRNRVELGTSAELLPLG
jgi:two-component system chemotaxis response regulator CheY